MFPEDPHASPFDEEETSPSIEPEAIESEEPVRERTSAPGVPPGYLTLREHRDKTEKTYILETLRLTGWNISRTAVVLGVERTNLHKKIRAYGIKREN